MTTKQPLGMIILKFAQIFNRTMWIRMSVFGFQHLVVRNMSPQMEYVFYT